MDVRNAFVAHESIEEIAMDSTKVARKLISAQLACFYILSKNNDLVLVALDGLSQEQEKLGSAWMSGERRVQIGEGLVGRAAELAKTSQFGVAQWTQDFGVDLPDSLRAAYKQKLGHIGAAIAVPLNGRNRTLGILHVVNKMGSDQESGSARFSNDDIYWLSVLGNNAANAVSRIFTEYEIQTLRDIGQLLLEPFRPTSSDSEVLSSVAEMLVGPLTFNNVCIIRKKEAERLIRVAWATDGMDSEALTDTDSRSVLTSNKPFFRSVCRASAGDAKKYSYACLPISIPGAVVGTISIFRTFEDKFHSDERSFLLNVASLVAAYCESAKTLEDLRETQRLLDQESERAQAFARMVGYDSASTNILHEYKNTLINIYTDLRELKEGTLSEAEGRLTLDRQIQYLQEKIENIKSELVAVHVSLDISSILKELTRATTARLIGLNVEVQLNLAPDLPLIVVNEHEIRDVLTNIMSNAMQAIREDSSEAGKITIQTGTTVISQIPYITIEISDSGVGIPSGSLEKIFERSFTTRKNGTGLGLFLSQKIIELYGGKIAVDSILGRGSRFSILLPRRRLAIGEF